MIDEIEEALLEPIRRVAFAADRFEPFPQTIISHRTLNELVEAGFVETGRSCRPAVGPVGYRLTTKGWQLAADRWTERRPAF